MQALILPDSVPPDLGVWRLDLTTVSPADWRTLTPEEEARAWRYRRDADRARYVGARAGLRRILSARLGMAPRLIPVMAGMHGKPALAAPHGERLHFNLSHAGACALVAVSERREVGVDVECDHDGLRVEELAPLALVAGAEPLAWRDVDGSAGFLRRWTAKEAALKAWGVGVAQHLLAVQAHPGARQPEIAVQAACADWPACAACELAMPEGYVAALAWLAAADESAHRIEAPAGGRAEYLQGQRS